MDPIKQIDQILNAPDASFQDLLRVARLDPARDLRGCDFSGVDFGALEAAVIDLTHCDLRGADLSRVIGTVILRGASLDSSTVPPRLAVFDFNDPPRGDGPAPSNYADLMRLVANYHLTSDVPERVVERIFEERFVAGGYDSTLQQDLHFRELLPAIEKRIDSFRIHENRAWSQGTSQAQFATNFLPKAGIRSQRPISEASIIGGEWSTSHAGSRFTRTPPALKT
jgi:hypothetical protein